MKTFPLNSTLAGVFLLSLALGAWWVFFLSNPEGRIRTAIKEGGGAIETGDLEGAMSHVSTDYRDEKGLTYLVVKRLLRDAFDQFDHFEIEMEDPEIEFVKGEDPGAWARFDLRLFVELEGRRGLLVGSLDEPAHLEIFFIKKPWGWLVREIRGVRPPSGG
ncbi:MAG TPA: hypothetical protein VIU33_02630 [Nitrospiria bacterium]